MFRSVKVQREKKKALLKLYINTHTVECHKNINPILPVKKNYFIIFDNQLPINNNIPVAN